jgi:hypothetical protein
MAACRGRACRWGTAPRHRPAQGSSPGVGAGGTRRGRRGRATPRPEQGPRGCTMAGEAGSRHHAGAEGRAGARRRGRRAGAGVPGWPPRGHAPRASRHGRRARGKREGGGHAGLEKGRGKAGKRGAGAHRAGKGRGRCRTGQGSCTGGEGPCAGERERERFWGEGGNDRLGPQGRRRRQRERGRDFMDKLI